MLMEAKNSAGMTTMPWIRWTFASTPTETGKTGLFNMDLQKWMAYGNRTIIIQNAICDNIIAKSRINNVQLINTKEVIPFKLL